MFSPRDMICFQSGFRPIRSRTVLIAAPALTLFRRPDHPLSFNTPQFLIMSNCPIDEISRNLLWFQEFENFRIWYSVSVKCNHSHAVSLETTLHVNTVTEVRKLPWNAYLKGQQSKNNEPLSPSASLSPAADCMNFGAELCMYVSDVWLTVQRNSVWVRKTN